MREWCQNIGLQYLWLFTIYLKGRIEANAAWLLLALPVKLKLLQLEMQER